MTKEEIQNRIEQVAYDGAADGCNQAVIEREAEKLADEIVKLFAIPVVSKRCFCGAEYDGIECNSCGFDASEVDIY